MGQIILKILEEAVKLLGKVQDVKITIDLTGIKVGSIESRNGFEKSEFKCERDL